MLEIFPPIRILVMETFTPLTHHKEMALTKQQTDLLILGNSQEFWRFESDADYANTASMYDNVCTLIEQGEMEGTDGNGNPVDIENYPIRQRPGTRPSY